ncbi:MAG TPA: hypothetical protein EYO45_05760 [Candidatus Marinimicrobia bacterium]|nr:hypothetical protein [Candidatus Neomarinimicrobiota bacterium]HIB32598.1 hypothetical protein [Candidatus Neomarinimicrobiota bacterium]
MKRETLISTSLLVVGAIFLIGRMFFSEHGMGKAYVRAVEVKSSETDPEINWTIYEKATQRKYHEAVTIDPDQKEYQFSLSRTLGIWIAALFTLFILSFLYKDNPLYKIAESVVVGVSAAYWMVVGFWTTIVPNLLGKLSPGWIKSWAMPGLKTEAELIYLIPLVMGVMLLWRLAPKGSWISRWPLAFIIGTTAGIRLIGFLHADFLGQIRNTIMSLVVTTPDTGFDFWDSMKNVVVVIGVLSTIVYFFFSIEHKGYVGKIAKLGIWFMMITFGAAFGYTVMGRIALLAIRIEFLLNDWLWLIDPANTRIGM